MQKIEQTDKFIYCKIPMSEVEDIAHLDKISFNLSAQIIEIANTKIANRQWKSADIFFRNEFNVDNVNSFHKIVCANEGATVDEIINFFDKI
jgi:hypothetical protein